MPTQILPITVGASASFRTDDRIFLGEGLFETIRVDLQRPCYPQLHWHRMRQSAMFLGIPFELTSNVWCEKLVECIHVSQIHTGGIKVILSGGGAPRGLVAHGDTSSLLFKAFTYPPPWQALRLASSRWLRDARNPIYQLKSVNYLESIMARREALACGADDALFFNLDHHATETTIANLFIVKQDRLLTPMLGDGVLSGIIRDRLLHLCLGSGIDCIETSIDSTTIGEADAVFVTNVLQGIRLVKSFDGNRMPLHHPLIALLRQLLATDVMLRV